MKYFASLTALLLSASLAHAQFAGATTSSSSSSSSTTTTTTPAAPVADVEFVQPPVVFAQPSCAPAMSYGYMSGYGMRSFAYSPGYGYARSFSPYFATNRALLGYGYGASAFFAPGRVHASSAFIVPSARVNVRVGAVAAPRREVVRQRTVIRRK